MNQSNRRANPPIRAIAVALVASGLLAACGGSANPTRDTPANTQADRYAQRESLFGPEGLSFSTAPTRPGDEVGGGAGIGVNSFLWRATLDTVTFMPVSAADPFGGVILTDWYSPPGSPGERFKVNVYILDRQLRADGLRVAVFRQVRDSAAGWIDAPVDPATATALEDTILSRARELRVTATAAAAR
ncbi:MAG: DUF3576 domain-containing protein [Inquilinus sp.]|nr:DUF3576 domain-containing protein [Inquilinus sp.]